MMEEFFKRSKISFFLTRNVLVAFCNGYCKWLVLARRWGWLTRLHTMHNMLKETVTWSDARVYS